MPWRDCYIPISFFNGTYWSSTCFLNYMIKLNSYNLIIFSIVFCIEVIIALFGHGFIRAFFGDFLVVIMLYYFMASFINIKSNYLALIVLLIAYFVEFLQFIDILSMVNYQKNTFVNTILGTTYHNMDMLAYTLGIATVILLENRVKPYFNS